MRRNDWWSIMFYNCVVVLVFAILAVKFTKWWVALFAILFTQHIHTVHNHRLFCDNCGKLGPIAKDSSSAVNEAVKAGWLHEKNDNGAYEDYCPECRHNIFTVNKDEE